MLVTGNATALGKKLLISMMRMETLYLLGIKGIPRQVDVKCLTRSTLDYFLGDFCLLTLKSAC